MPPEFEAYEEEVYASLDKEFERIRVEACLVKGYSWMPPLEGFNVGTTVFRWFRLEATGRYGGYLEPVLIGSSPETNPEWVEHDDPVDIISHPSLDKYYWVKWGLVVGISPGQPFLVGFSEPVYSQGYEGDWDADYDWDIVRILPKNIVSGIHAWESTLKKINHWERQLANHNKHQKRLAIALKHRWNLVAEHRGQYGQNICLSLVCRSKAFSNFEQSYMLAQGYSNSKHIGSSYHRGTTDEAFSNLLSNFRFHYPTEDITRILDLAGKYNISLSILDRIILGQTG